jgi:predicted Zn-dependent peptidase
MISCYKRISLSPDTTYTVITDEKFKTNTWKVRFYIPIDKINPSAVSIASDIIVSCNSEYRTMSDIYSKLNTLYGADIYSSTAKRGDILSVTVSANTIDEAFALNNEKLNIETVNLLLDCIFSPYVKDGKFDEEIFEIKKRDLLDSILSEINDKRKYIFLKANEHIYKNEPAGIFLYGSYEDAQKITAKEALDTWNYLLENSAKEIYFVGPKQIENIDEIIQKAFSSDSKNKNIIFNTPSPAKSEPIEVTEELDVSQSKIVMAYKSDNQDRYSMRLMNMILGGLPSSKLFRNVREKQSLCYYCQSSYSVSKQTLLIDCGVEKDNIEKAKQAISEQIKAIQSGDISESEINSALISIDNSLKGHGDVPSSYTNWYSECFCMNDYITPEESMKRYHEITKDMICKASLSLKPDTVYILKPKS